MLLKTSSLPEEDRVPTLQQTLNDSSRRCGKTSGLCYNSSNLALAVPNSSCALESPKKPPEIGGSPCRSAKANSLGHGVQKRLYFKVPK